MDVVTSIITSGFTIMAILMSAYHFARMKQSEKESTLAYDDRDRMSDLLHEERKSNQKLTEKLKLSIDDQDRLKDEIEHLNKVIATLKLELNKSKQTADYRMNLIDEQREAMHNRDAAIRQLESDIDSLNDTIKELQVKAERDERHFEQTCDKLNELVKEINRLNESVAEKDSIIEDMKYCFEEDKKNVLEKCRELNEHAHEIDRLNEVNSELDKFVVDLKQDNASLHYRLSIAESQRDDLARRLGETTAINVNLKELAIHCQNFLSVWREETDKAFATLQNHVKQGLESQLITEPVQQQNQQENDDATQQGI